MKKKIFGGIAVLAIAAVAAWNVNLGSKSNGLSDVFLANVEALADETQIPYEQTACYSYTERNAWGNEFLVRVCSSCHLSVVTFFVVTSKC